MKVKVPTCVMPYSLTLSKHSKELLVYLFGNV